jgi:hypothetical protein
MNHRRIGFVLFAVLFVGILISTWTSNTLAQAARKYAVMTVDEARRRVEAVVRDGTAPPPDAGSQWTLPEIALYARGVTINATNYIAFAATEPSRILVPARAAPGVSDSAELEHRAFVLNGLVFSTVDFQVANARVFSSETSEWRRISSVIPKGGYTWYLGAGGVYLMDRDGKGSLISFDKPLKNISLRVRHDVDLSVGSGRDPAILVKLAGAVITIK